MKPFLAPRAESLLDAYAAYRERVPARSCFIPKAPQRIADAGRVRGDAAYVVTARTIGRGIRPARSLVLVSRGGEVDDVVPMGDDGRPDFGQSIVTIVKRFHGDPNCRRK